MAATASPIELSVHRQSRFFDPSEPNPYDANYIPLLSSTADLRVDFSLPAFSALPSIPTPQKERSSSLARTKSASAPERVVPNHNEEPMPERPSASRYTTAQEIGSSQTLSNDDHSSTDNSTEAGSEETAATALEDHVFMIPGNSMPKPEDLARPVMTHSARSSVSSQVHRKSQVPTSRYNQKKSLPQVPSISPTMTSTQQQVVRKESPRTSPEPPVGGSSRAGKLATLQSIPAPIEPQGTTAKILPAKSTASQRRQRALNSHPSNISLHSNPASVHDDDETPLVPSAEFTPRPGTSRSRSQSICNLAQPSPAPTTPLPDLPPIAKRPPTRERASVHVASQSIAFNAAPVGLGLSTPSTIATPIVPSPALLPRANEHIEMANFMTSQKTVVFRRFDDVHVRLLLHLQDEIATFEKEMDEVDNPANSAPDKYVRKANVMRHLRKALAEYDHLFANWSQMQTNKASSETREQLMKWLQNPATGSSAISSGAREDMAWLQNSKDLSSVSIDPVKVPSPKSGLDEKRLSSSSTSGPSNSGAGGGGSGTAGGAGGFAALFGCASKRK